MRYIVVKINSNEFNVVEHGSEQILYTCSQYDEARKLAIHLESGGGFDGYTPPFFTKTMNKQANAEIKEIYAESVASGSGI